MFGAVFVLLTVGCGFPAVAVESAVAGLQPWKAAQALLNVLPQETVLKDIDLDTVEVFCGQRMEVGLQLGGRLHEAMIGHERDWKKLEPEGLWRADGATSGLDVVTDGCVLPEVSLTGPLEIHWTTPSRGMLVNPPEPYSVPGVERLVIEDGVQIRLGGLTELRLKEPLALPDLPVGYVESLQRRKNDQRAMSRAEGLSQMSSSLRHRARGTTSRPLILQATSAVRGFSLRRHNQSPINVIEAAPGLLRISPYASRNERSMRSLQLVQIWPFVDVSASQALPYEELLKHFVTHHRLEFASSRAGMKLQTASARAVTLLRIQVEVRSEAGYTQFVDAHVLVDAEDRYTPIGARSVKPELYTATISPLDIFYNQTANPSLSLHHMYL